MSGDTDGAYLMMQRRPRGRPPQTHSDAKKAARQAYQAQYHVDRYHGDDAWREARKTSNKQRYHKKKLAHIAELVDELRGV